MNVFVLRCYRFNKFLLIAKQLNFLHLLIPQFYLWSGLLILDNIMLFCRLALYFLSLILSDHFYSYVFLCVNCFAPTDSLTMFSNERYSSFNIFCYAKKKFNEKSSSESYWRQTIGFFFNGKKVLAIII